ncbi:MAG: hypothetical protein ACR2RL_16800 [Gammaproteobacteria bacterium]
MRTLSPAYRSEFDRVDAHDIDRIPGNLDESHGAASCITGHPIIVPPQIALLTRVGFARRLGVCMRLDKPWNSTTIPD